MSVEGLSKFSGSLKILGLKASDEIREDLDRIRYLIISQRYFTKKSDNVGLHQLTMRITNHLKGKDSQKIWKGFLLAFQGVSIPVNTGGFVTLSFARELKVLNK